MAALFKVVRHDKPTERKAVKAASIDEVISLAKIKLKLTDEKYKLYTDDFTEIDEDEILMDLAKAKGSDQLLLTIVPEGMPWNGILGTAPISSTESQQETASKTSSSRQSDFPPSTSSSWSHKTDHLSQIFPKFATNVQTALRTGLSLSPRSRRRMVHTVRDYLINDLKDTSRGITDSISKEIVNTYKKTFASKVANRGTEGEAESLRQSIYFAAHYIMGQAGNGSKPFDNLDDDLTIEKPKVQDEYGCIAYMPAQPSPEDIASLEEKRLRLINSFTSPGENNIDDEIINLMGESYYLQRKQINKEKELSVIFQHWPYFHNYKLIIKHANELLGKNINLIWKSSLRNLSKPINLTSRNEEIAREVNAKKTNKQPADGQSKYFVHRQVRETLKIAKQYSENFKNDEPYYTVTFGFIANCMRENEELNDEELLQRVPCVNPVLMIRGKDLHDTTNIYNVVMNKSIMIHVSSFTVGILTTFLCYYVFSIVYPPEIEGTLEAIQRLFLEINPPKGTKRGGKRKGTNIHPKVSKLIKAIDPYLPDN